ncbi:NAD-dependent epimerase/dehydratase family protein [Aureimonas ureilytica]|uniref:NAD-dependent epimerase/dehydratase family protein n=1 Tax=Aureimonas ureilytica TaxID=401562 RepID=UPI00036C2869|nr:NAD(P)-dependent oxidoreductase [Aureimonas ureilytica]
MAHKTVLVTGANGYIGNAVAKAFSRAGWRVYGLVRRPEAANDLARHEIHPVLGSPDELSFLDRTDGVAFDVVVSNTEDRKDPRGHLAKVGAMLDTIMRRSTDAGIGRPLAMFSSGCKDYGMMGEKHGDAGLAPHTEASPLNPPAVLVPRCEFGARLLDKSRTPYDAIVLRPTIVYGLSSSHYGSLFDLAAKSDGVLRLVADPDAVMHSCHVEDCAEAYVRLAEHPERAAVANQAFNISNTRYETAREIGEGLARSYGLSLEFVAPEDGAGSDFDSVHGLANFWQWVGSEKIRAAAGWKEKRAAFADGIAEYRLAYEATVVPGN